MDELVDIIREYEAENEAFENLFYLCCSEVDEIRDEIKVVKENRKYLQSIQKVTISACDSSEKSYGNECICSTLKEEIWKLRMEIILKNKKIQALELQIHSRNALHKICKRRLQQLSRAHSYKISKLKAEIEQIQMAVLCTKAEECEDEMIHEIEEGESDLEECNSISPKKEIKEEIQEIRNKLLLSLNL
ncbi:hypothetical protein ALC56_01804 [Trachymyrmex septentrionalis]|uniref:Uncharacterized protein n=1 Tax=Trachymyrmex septentrionalis TaxID=34720 RepID=A0A195FSW8_9HYME|nr:PREDICTED: uncharacterized protein PF11_0207-like [Trachymyrmex septentrionalis]KYN43543.1 hypothetical protein ALC56_01804 [Trachymyrmex septentrionalis]